MAELHPGAARKIRGRLEGARLLTIGLEGWFLPFEEGQARHNIPRTVPLSTASPKKAAETRHTIPSKEGNAPLSTVTIYSIKEGIREIPVNMKREPLPLPAPKIGTHVRNTPNARRRTGEHDEKATAREGRGAAFEADTAMLGLYRPDLNRNEAQGKHGRGKDSRNSWSGSGTGHLFLWPPLPDVEGRRNPPVLPI